MCDDLHEFISLISLPASVQQAHTFVSLSELAVRYFLPHLRCHGQYFGPILGNDMSGELEIIMIIPNACHLWGPDYTFVATLRGVKSKLKRIK